MNGKPLERQPIFWFYGFAATAYGIKNNAFSYLLLIYANQALGLPGYLASVALGVAMLWDAVSDLLLGHWSDKTRSRLGRRHPFMYAAFLFLPVCFYALFNPLIELNDQNLFAYVLVTALLIRTGTTLFEVPSTALLPDLEVDYDRRSKWLALRHAFGWYGGNGIHTVNFLFWVGAYGVAAREGYAIYGSVGAGLIAIAILVSTLGTQKVAAALPPPRESFRFDAITYEIRQIFQSVRNPNFRALFLYAMLTGVATGLGTALYLYNTTYFFAFSGKQIAATGVVIFVAPLIGYGVAPALGRKLGKKRAAIAAILCLMALYPVPYLLVLSGYWPELGSWKSLWIYSGFILAEVVGAIVGNVLLDSMMADVVEDSEVSTTRRSEGLFYAARNFAFKAISAGGILFAGTIVSLVGLDDVNSVDQVTREIRVDLASFFLPLYSALYIAALYAVSRYGIDRSRHRSNLETLAQRDRSE